MIQRISVIICAYTEARWDELVAAVNSLQNQTFPALEIVVVIDHNPALIERVKAHIPNVTVTTNTEQQGLAGARNSGLRVASGEIVAFMDEDAVAAPDWLEQLSSAYTGSNVIGSGGAIEPMWVDQRPIWFPREFDWVVGCTYPGLPETVSPVRNLIGCNMSFRRELFDEIGGFRNGIGRVGTRPVGCEETEFCIRATQTHVGGQFLYVPSARVYHRVPGIRAKWSYFRSRCYSEGLSKALISRFVGAKDSLTSERAYTFRVLPLGVLRGIADTVRYRQLAGLLRAVAIVSGLMFTTLGYLRGRLLEMRRPVFSDAEIAGAHNELEQIG